MHVQCCPIHHRIMLTGILAENSGQDIEKVKADCERDHYLSAAEAVEYGLIDKVVTSQE